MAINIGTDCCTFLLEVVATDIVGPRRDGLHSQRSCQAVGVHVVEGLDHVSDLRSEVGLNIYSLLISNISINHQVLDKNVKNIT